jgi:hypothetical protein
MKQLNSNGGQNFMAFLPTTRAYAHESASSVSDGLRSLLGIVPTTAPAPTAAGAEPSDAASLQRFREALTALELEAGDEILSPADRAAIEADPTELREWLSKHDAARAEVKKDNEAAAAELEAAAKKAAASARGRRVSSGLAAVLKAARK